MIKLNGNEITDSQGNATMIFPMAAKVLSEIIDAYPGVALHSDLMAKFRIMDVHTLRQHIVKIRKGLVVVGGYEIVTHNKVGYALKVKGE